MAPQRSEDRHNLIHMCVHITDFLYICLGVIMVTMYKILIRNAALFGLATFLFDTAARQFYWYYAMPHIDTVSHTLGGMFTAYIIAALSWSFIQKKSPLYIFWYVFMLTVIVGIFWEFYEYGVYFFTNTRYFIDVNNSMSDVVCDTFGGLIASYMVFLRNKRYNKSNAK